MAKVLLTGMSGTGKSTALAELGARGHRVVDTDSDEWNEWVALPDGSQDWVWRLDAITELLTGHRAGHLFVAGCRSNQDRCYPLFDRIVLLSAPIDVMLARIVARTTNQFGKSPAERAKILADHAEVQPLLRAGVDLEIDTTAPLGAVVDQLERAADLVHAGP
ncbi:AAA family ATPase [Nannocystis radixulma]